MGYATLIGDNYADDKDRGPQKTGSLWGLAAFAKPLTLPDEWLTLEVMARANHLQVFVNGQKTADYLDEKWSWTRGHLALLHHADQARVLFRKIEIKELPPEQK